MNREEMEKRIFAQLETMNREQLEMVNSFLDELEKEYPADTRQNRRRNQQQRNNQGGSCRGLSFLQVKDRGRADGTRHRQRSGKGAAGTRYRAQLQQDRNQATGTRRDPEPAEKKGRA